MGCRERSCVCVVFILSFGRFGYLFFISFLKSFFVSNLRMSFNFCLVMEFDLESRSGRIIRWVSIILRLVICVMRFFIDVRVIKR